MPKAELTLTKSELRGMLAETVHAAFRKGTSRPGAQRVWEAIHDMDPKAWGECVDWMVWALFYAKERATEKSQAPKKTLTARKRS